MAIVNFIPEVWAAELLASLKKSLVYAGPGVVNRRYEGLITNAGDTVRITSISRPAIADYVAGVTNIVPEPLTDASRSLTISQSKYFAFEVDDIEKRQAQSGVLEEGMREAAFGLADVADQFVAALYTGVQTANVVPAVNLSAGDAAAVDLAYVTLVKLAQKLDEASVAGTDRWVIIPPAYHTLLLRDARFTDASASGMASVALNGRVGMVAGMTVMTSNNAPVPGANSRAVIAGTQDAISFAEQINKTEAFRPESAFSDAVKGLHLYGAKLVRPDGLAIVTAQLT